MYENEYGYECHRINVEYNIAYNYIKQGILSRTRSRTQKIMHGAPLSEWQGHSAGKAGLSAPRTPLLALGFISAPRELDRRAYLRPTLIAIGTSNLGYRFVVGDSQSIRLSAQLGAESSAFGDLCRLSGLADGGKERLSEKTLLWFRAAVTTFPHAAWFGKTDTDTVIAWERLQQPLRWLATQPIWRDARLFFGRLLWTSYLDSARTFCGCCASHADHGRLLQTSSAAAWGPCAAETDRPTSASPVRYSRLHNSSVRGPFPFAFGAFYAVSSQTAEWLARSKHAARMRRRLRSGSLSVRMRYTEDALFGEVVIRCPGLTVLAASWDAIANLDEVCELLLL